MKIIIKDKILVGNENIEYHIELLKYYSIHFEINSDGLIEIGEQKITLDEIDVNELFFEIFYDSKIEYCAIGGKGCEFSISIISS